ncbi:unnamed protein product [Pseudo-nitzschia multistriata]|uniref:Uncharacterized protein n=1 Tax=Pseudo-nitzschia multistriata TaxID=183589 RepID=A0A448Z6D6_9STRA|nr:unnamed protein product [Pseudo-nitzschia multistriata]
MLPVLQPSMCEVESSSNDHQPIGNGNGTVEPQTQSPTSIHGHGHIQHSKSDAWEEFRNETSIASEQRPHVLFGRLQLRVRSCCLSYRRHRYFYRSLVALWAWAVVVSIGAIWRAGAGDGIMEFLSISTRPPVDICFVTAQYASSRDQLDNLVNLREEAPRFFSDRNSDHYRFFAFTNQKDWIDELPGTEPATSTSTKTNPNTDANTDAKTKTKTKPKDNGWTILVKEFPPHTFQRFITQSRWPKFQGFQHKQIVRSCDVVFYMDGTVLPIGSPWRFQTEARRILDSYVQLSQEPHPHQDEDGGGIAGEMSRCRRKGKDIESNLKATNDWFRAQPDFTNDCQLYQNTFFGYAVNSPFFRRAANFAWEHFSQEKDSWRDQPLWCYTLHHFGITPLVLPGNLFRYQAGRRGGNAHRHDESANNNAQLFYEAKTNARKNAAGDGAGGASDLPTGGKPGPAATATIQ